MSVRGRYTGTIEPDHDNGGSCRLVLQGGCFELSMTRSAPYGIEDGQRLAGAYAVRGDQIDFSSEEFCAWSWETVKQEHRERRPMQFLGRLGPARSADGIRPIVIELRLRAAWPLDLTLWPDPA